MSNSIWKFEFEVSDDVQIREMPRDAEVVYVGLQAGLICAWARVVPARSMERRQFRVVGTGHPVNGDDKYLGTVQQPPFVWHLFETGLT